MHVSNNPQDLKTIYQEICRAHDSIANFRAKLLALLPIASGAGIFLLVGNLPRNAEFFHLLPVGIFGVLITVGLFLYELRGIQKCNSLIESAKRLENKMAPGWGSFSVRPTGVLRGFAGATGAALVIYPSVAGAWVYIAGLGWSISTEPGVWVMIAAAIAAIGFALLGLGILSLQKKKLDKKLKTVKNEEN